MKGGLSEAPRPHILKILELVYLIMRGSRLAPLIISTSSLMPLCSLLAGGGAPPLWRYEPRARAYCGGRYLAGRRHHRAGRYLAGRRYHTPVV